MKNILLLTFVALFHNTFANPVITAPLGPCECAVFGKTEVSSHEKPVLKQRPMNVTCEDVGKQTCVKMCKALAEAAKARGPTLLCTAVRHIHNLQPSIFTRTCDTQEWTYTGLTAQELFCCHDGEPIPCNEQKPTNFQSFIYN